MDVRIETIRPIRVARIRHIGPHAEVGPYFERLFRWAAAIGAPTGRVLTLFWDNPRTAPPDRLCSDACVELRTREEAPPGIALGAAGGGRYAVHRLAGPYERISSAYARLFEERLAGSGESVDERPFMELYRNSDLDTAPEQLATDLCLPLAGHRI